MGGCDMLGEVVRLLPIDHGEANREDVVGFRLPLKDHLKCVIVPDIRDLLIPGIVVHLLRRHVAGRENDRLRAGRRRHEDASSGNLLICHEDAAESHTITGILRLLAVQGESLVKDLTDELQSRESGLEGDEEIASTWLVKPEGCHVGRGTVLEVVWRFQFYLGVFFIDLLLLPPVIV